jgi:predicted transcriptional regulator
MSVVHTIDKKINEYLHHLNYKQKQTVLTVIKTFAGNEEVWWEEVEKSASIAIKQGLKDAAENNETSHEEVMKKYKKWLPK